MSTQYKSVWDALYVDPDEANDLKKRSDYSILIQARLYGLSGRQGQTVRDLMAGKIHKFNLPQLIAIARKVGVTVRL